MSVREFLTPELFAQIEGMLEKDPQGIIDQLTKELQELTDKELAGLYCAVVIVTAGIDSAARERGL